MSNFEYFKPYEGDKPYIFISYAHADNDAVLPIVSDMHSRGYNIWYDEGIEVGSEWQECIASHLADAHLVVAFISNAYMRSDNCRREMHYAQSKKIKTINIFIEDTALTPGMELQIGNIFALMKYTYPSDEYFYDKLYSAPLLNSESFADSAPRPTTETQKAIPAASPKTKEKKEKKKPGKGRKIARWSIAVAVFGLILAALPTVRYANLKTLFLKMPRENIRERKPATSPSASLKGLRSCISSEMSTACTNRSPASGRSAKAIKQRPIQIGREMKRP